MPWGVPAVHLEDPCTGIGIDPLTRKTQSQLRILMISPQFRPITGGYERAAERLSASLAAAGHEVEVVTERREAEWPGLEVSQGFTIHRIPVINRRGVHSLTSILAFSLFLLRRGRHFDLFHVHQYGWPAAIASAAGLVFHKSVFLKLTNTGHQGIDAALPRGVIGSMMRRLHLKISCCIVTSTRAAQEAEDFGFARNRICQIPNPLETGTFRPATKDDAQELRKELGLDGKFVAVCAARLTAQKNHRMLIQAWNIVSTKIKNVQLILLGGGPLEDEIRALAANSENPETIRVHGSTDNPLRWYQAADVYALSSDVEGLSNSLMEALSSGLSIVSTRVSGSEDILEEVDVGEIVPIGDHLAMAEALISLAQDPERRRQCGERAREYAIQHYSVASIAKRMEACYRSHLD